MRALEKKQRILHRGHKESRVHRERKIPEVKKQLRGRNRMAPGASEGGLEFMCAKGVRRKRMRFALAKAAVVAAVGLGICLGSACVARAGNRTPKGPDEDGTKPALVKIAGEGMMDSHAFQYLTELSDDIGARVTGSPAERRAEEWGAAKMKAIGLENVHKE